MAQHVRLNEPRTVNGVLHPVGAVVRIPSCMVKPLKNKGKIDEIRGGELQSAKKASRAEKAAKDEARAKRVKKAQK